MTNYFLYIDPGTGSMLLQAIIAGTLGVAMFFNQLKFRVLTFFGRPVIHEKVSELKEEESKIEA